MPQRARKLYDKIIRPPQRTGDLPHLKRPAAPECASRALCSAAAIHLARVVDLRVALVTLAPHGNARFRLQPPG
jgi:hypothetical protein